MSILMFVLGVRFVPLIFGVLSAPASFNLDLILVRHLQLSVIITYPSVACLAPFERF